MELMGLDTSNIPNPELRVCDIITEDTCWDIDKIRSLINQEDIIKKIIGIPLPLTEAEDSCCWGLTGSAHFSTKQQLGQLTRILTLLIQNGLLDGFGNWI